jgi:hypothetical protein
VSLLGRWRRPSASARDDVVRAAVVAGLALPAWVTLLALLPFVFFPFSDLPSWEADRRDLEMAFFGLAALPFTLIALGVAVLRPPRDVRLRLLNGLVLALAMASAYFTFGGHRFLLRP